jgi:mannose-1-phosphate guanylyltransferase / phosphomannomutase
LKALILAAGEGTRLRPLTFLRQKPMIPVGPEPSIFYLISHLAEEGFDDIVMVVGGSLKQHLIDYLGDGSRLGVHITYVVKPDEFHCGTAGCLKLLDGLIDDTFLVAQSDILTEIPLRKAVEFHRSTGSLATIVLTKVDDPTSFGVAVLNDEGAITAFQEKPTAEEAESDLVSTGFYILEPECMDFLMDEKWDFANDLFPHLLKVHKRVSGYVSEAFWVDIGRLDGYLRGVTWTLQKIAQQTLQNFVITDPSRPVMVERGAVIGQTAKIMGPALIEAGVVIQDGATVEGGCLIKRDVSVSTGVVLRRSVVLERSEIGERSTIMNSVIGQSATVGRNVLMNKAIVGSGSVVGDGAKLLVDSRTWPNAQIKDAEIVEGTVTVPVEKAFYFCTDLGQYIGLMASSTNGFAESLEKAPLQSLEFHAKRRDFEKWVRDVLGSNEFADAIADACKDGSQGEELRAKLVSVTKKRVAGEPDSDLLRLSAQDLLSEIEDSKYGSVRHLLPQKNN